MSNLCKQTAPTGSGFGLYIHVPYCRALCHYCDFAKTANFDAEHPKRYVARLIEHAKAWIRLLEDHQGLPAAFTSVFFGGGTPSLLTREYGPLFEVLGPYLDPACEISLEANPDDIDGTSLSTWRALGVNRLSVGVQTFHEQGLHFLKRSHDGDAAMHAVEMAAKFIPSVNVDLIYGWQDQNPELLAHDIEQAQLLGAAHLSLYNLTYEERTPLGRAYHRGMLQAQPDDDLAAYYALAAEVLTSKGFLQEEVSNWCKPGHACRHNRLYWTDAPYLGIGAGAHGYLPAIESSGAITQDVGWRYAYDRSDRVFLRRDVVADGSCPMVQGELNRTADDWLTEYVGCGLRCDAGINIACAESVSGKTFCARPMVAKALQSGALKYDSDGTLTLEREEWFRETAWSVEVILSFVNCSH